MRRVMRGVKSQLMFVLMLMLFWGMGQNISHAACAALVCLPEMAEEAYSAEEGEGGCQMGAEHVHHSAQVPNWRSEPQGCPVPQAAAEPEAIPLPMLPVLRRAAHGNRAPARAPDPGGWRCLPLRL